MQKTLGMLLLIVAASACCWASPVAPEIDPASGGSAIALIAGALLVIRSRRR